MGITHYGWAESTPAMRSILAGGVGTVRRKIKRRAKKALAKRVKRVVRSKAARKGAKFVKGSAAAKRHMAKLRKMVKRK